MTEKKSQGPRKRPRRTTAPKKKASTTTFSTRVSADEKALIERAAEARSWTTSNLIRIAATDRAAHIVNMEESDVRGSLAALADTIATQLFRPELMTEGGLPTHLTSVYDTDLGEELEPSSLPRLR